MTAFRSWWELRRIPGTGPVDARERETVGAPTHNRTRERTGRLLPRHPRLVPRGLRGAHGRPGGGVGGGAGGPARARGRTHRLGQDPCGVPVGAGPAGLGQPAAGSAAPLPGPLRLAAQGPGRRRAAQPARAAHGHPAGGAAGRHAAARDHGGDAYRRHPGGRAAAVRPHAAGCAGHHPGVAVPAAHLGGPGVVARRAHGHPGRGARGGGHQARRAPRAVAGAARRAARLCLQDTRTRAQPSGSGCRRRSGRWTRWRRSWPGPGRWRSCSHPPPRRSRWPSRCRCRTSRRWTSGRRRGRRTRRSSARRPVPRSGRRSGRRWNGGCWTSSGSTARRSCSPTRGASPSG